LGVAQGRVANRRGQACGVKVRVCAAAACPVLTQRSYCDLHAAGRLNSDPAWPTIQARVLAEQPLCPCGSPATEVDHIVPRRAGGTHERSNLQGLCKGCHSRKTIAGE
jgi:5-methylcytosine-specific restriction enzyme A